jgi:hypothetical protein
VPQPQRPAYASPSQTMRSAAAENSARRCFPGRSSDGAFVSPKLRAREHCPHKNCVTGMVTVCPSVEHRVSNEQPVKDARAIVPQDIIRCSCLTLTRLARQSPE